MNWVGAQGGKRHSREQAKESGRARNGGRAPNGRNATTETTGDVDGPDGLDKAPASSNQVSTKAALGEPKNTNQVEADLKKRTEVCYRYQPENSSTLRI